MTKNEFMAFIEFAEAHLEGDGYQIAVNIGARTVVGDFGYVGDPKDPVGIWIKDGEKPPAMIPFSSVLAIQGPLPCPQL